MNATDEGTEGEIQGAKDGDVNDGVDDTDTDDYDGELDENNDLDLDYYDADGEERDKLSHDSESGKS